MLGWEFPPNISGGLGTACHGITRGLARREVDVLLVLPCAHGNEDRRFAQVVGCNHLDDLLEGRAVEHRPLPHEPTIDLLAVRSLLRPYMGRAGYERSLDELAEDRPFEPKGGYGPDLEREVERYARAVAEIARVQPFDVIHAHDWMTYPAGLLAREVSGKPLVCHLHSCEHDRSGGRVDPVICSIEKRGLTAADQAVCVSRYTADAVVRHYRLDPDRLRVVHNAVVPAPHREPPARPETEDRPLVLFLGRMTGQKGPDYFLDAAVLVLRERPEVRFLMSGDGDLLSELRERVNRLSLSESVHFTGFLSPEEVDGAYARADVYVMPSVSEPFGIASLEALSHGVPVIVSRQSGVTEVLESQLAVDYWDVQDMAKKILDVLGDPELRERLVERGREEVGRLGWKHCADALIDVYQELIQ